MIDEMERFKKKMETENLNRSEVAAKFGVTELTVYRWLMGKTKPKSETVLTRIRDFLIEGKTLDNSAKEKVRQVIQIVKVRSDGILETNKVEALNFLGSVKSLVESAEREIRKK
jgi:transcriptional regulator with XRE-family HTH domain